MLDAHLHRWGLQADGLPFSTPNGHLQPVLAAGVPAMLKVALAEDERRGGVLLEWWGGEGAAQVLAREGDAILMERATDPGRLERMSREGRDDEACAVLCGVAAGLHAARGGPAPDLVPLEAWFAPLHAAGEAHGGWLAEASRVARALVAEDAEPTALHGDLHHGNALPFGDRGWLAVDPKGLRGDRAMEFAPMFLFPDLLDEGCGVARDPGRFLARAAVVSRESGVGRRRLLSWVLSWAGLSAAWWLGAGRVPRVQAAVAAMAAAALSASACPAGRLGDAGAACEAARDSEGERMPGMRDGDGTAGAWERLGILLATTCCSVGLGVAAYGAAAPCGCRETALAGALLSSVGAGYIATYFAACLADDRLRRTPTPGRGRLAAVAGAWLGIPPGAGHAGLRARHLWRATLVALAMALMASPPSWVVGAALAEAPFPHATASGLTLLALGSSPAVAAVGLYMAALAASAREARRLQDRVTLATLAAVSAAFPVVGAIRVAETLMAP